MPRLHFERPNLPWPVLIALGAAVPPAGLHAALASAAGTLYEAAPFVLAAEVLPARLGAFASLVGCGCGKRRVPGALSLPATALCWLAFGPWVAAARFAVGVFLLQRERAARSRAADAPGPTDPFLELTGLVVPTVLASLAAQLLGDRAASLRGAWQPLLIAAGACLGAIVPCATAGIAFAAGLAHALPGAAAGLLATAGLARLSLDGRRHGSEASSRETRRPAGFASVLLAAALVAIACRGPSGLVNPRLLPLDAAAGVLALIGARRRLTAARAAPFVGAGLAWALVAGSTIPENVASETTLADAYPGQRIDFLGTAHVRGGATTIERFAISCCRLDAAPVAIRLTRKLPTADGAWVDVSGSFVRRSAELLVAPERWRAVTAPADPFTYR